LIDSGPVISKTMSLDHCVRSIAQDNVNPEMISDCTEETWWEKCGAPSCKHYPKIKALETQSIVKRKNMVKDNGLKSIYIRYFDNEAFAT